jgi:hypothetical protein
MVEEVKARKEREEEEKKGKTPGGGKGGKGGGKSDFKPIPGTVIGGVLQLTNLSGITTNDNLSLAPRGIKLSGNDLVLIYYEGNELQRTSHRCQIGKRLA